MPSTLTGSLVCHDSGLRFSRKKRLVGLCLWDRAAEHAWSRSHPASTFIKSLSMMTEDINEAAEENQGEQPEALNPGSGPRQNHRRL